MQRRVPAARNQALLLRVDRGRRQDQQQDQDAQTLVGKDLHACGILSVALSLVAHALRPPVGWRNRVAVSAQLV